MLPPPKTRALVLITPPASAYNQRLHRRLRLRLPGRAGRAPAQARQPLGPTVWLHPQARFAALADEFWLISIPSALAGVVVSAALRDWLLELRQPTPTAQLAGSHAARSLVEQCAELGLLVSDTPAPSAAPGETLVAWLHVTNACNLRCTYCYLSKTEEPMTSATEGDAVDATVRSARLHGYRAIKLKYAGGEAALNFRLIEELHGYRC